MRLSRLLKTILITYCAAAPAIAAPNLPAIDVLVAPIVGDTTPGLSVLVTRNGGVVHMAGYGLADVDTETAVTDRSTFDLASVSKQMTALAARAQIETGLYDENTEISTFLPQFAGAVSPRPLTVGDLLHHTSGLTDYISWDDYGADTAVSEVIDWLAQQDLDHAPGTQYDYSNSGYLVLGGLIAAADGAGDLAQVLQARFWGPAGMKDTSLPSPSAPDRRVTGYGGAGGDFEISFEPDRAQGDGNVFSTLADLARYEAGLSRGDFLEDTSALFAEGLLDNGQPLRDEDGSGYGYGWHVYSADDSAYAAHSGGWAGTSTYYLRNLTSGVSVILLANGEDADLWELADQIAASVQ